VAGFGRRSGKQIVWNLVLVEFNTQRRMEIDVLFLQRLN